MTGRDTTSVTITGRGRYRLELLPRESGPALVEVSFAGDDGRHDTVFLPVLGRTCLRIRTEHQRTTITAQAHEVAAMRVARQSRLGSVTLHPAVARFRRLANMHLANGIRIRMLWFGSPWVRSDAVRRLSAEVGLAAAAGLFPLRDRTLARPPPTPSLPPWKASRPAGGLRIAAAVHLRNPANWAEIEARLRAMTRPFRLVVTIAGESRDAADAIRKAFSAATVHPGPEGESSTSALVRLIVDGGLDEADLICCIHDLAPPTGAPDVILPAWRRACLAELMPDAEAVEIAIRRFAAHPELGMLQPAALAPWRRPSRAAPEEAWPGGMFWVRRRALDLLRPLAADAEGAGFGPSADDLGGSLSRRLAAMVRSAGLTVDELAAADIGRDVLSSDWQTLRPPGDVSGRRACLFVGLALGGSFRADACLHMQELRKLGFVVIALAVADPATMSVADPGPDCADAFAIRANGGFDFAIWAAALKRFPSLRTSASLLLVNDSIFGPVKPLDDTFRRINASDADLVGLTDSLATGRHHLQSYFLHFGPRALRSDAFAGFWDDVRELDDKDRVILLYETRLAETLAAAGLRTEALFPAASVGRADENPTLAHYEALLVRGFPYVKWRAIHDSARDWPAFVLRHSGRPDIAALLKEGARR